MTGLIEHLNAVPARLDIKAWQADAFVMSMEVVSTDAQGTEAPVDLTGVVPKMIVKRLPSSDERAAKAVMVPDDLAAGRFSMTIPAIQMSKLEGSYYYDVTADDPSGSGMRSLAWGSFYIYPWHPVP